MVRGDGGTDDCQRGLFKDLADLGSPWHFTGARMPGIVGQHHDITGKEGSMGAAQVQQHAVAAGNRNHPHAGYSRRRGEFPVVVHHPEYFRSVRPGGKSAWSMHEPVRYSAQ